MCDDKVTITEDCFGCIDGKSVRRYTMKNSGGFCVQVINYGATITSIMVPVRIGCPVDVVLGFDNVQGYLQNNNPYFGATIGRVTNRTSPFKFQLDGKCVCLTQNIEKGHIHGGVKGFDKMFWESCSGDGCVSMKYVSPDGEEGYPGTLTVTAIFSITKDNDLKIQYKAKTNKTTIVNMTNHSYFNLAGHGGGPEELYKHELKINADNYTKLVNMFATGDLVPVACTAYDFRSSKAIGDSIHDMCEDGYDVNYCLKPETNELKLAAEVSYKPNGLSMEVHTTAPGLQLYTSNGIDMICGKKRTCYRKQAALCLESQHYPNAANIKTFPSIELKPQDEYNHEIIYKFKST